MSRWQSGTNWSFFLSHSNVIYLLVFNRNLKNRNSYHLQRFLVFDLFSLKRRVQENNIQQHPLMKPCWWLECSGCRKKRQIIYSHSHFSPHSFIVARAKQKVIRSRLLQLQHNIFCLFCGLIFSDAVLLLFNKLLARIKNQRNVKTTIVKRPTSNAIE